MDKTKIIPLRTPIELGDQRYDKLELREPSAGEMDKASAASTNGITVAIILISEVAKIPLSVVRQLPATEFSEASKYLLGFIAGALLTGAAS